MAKHALKFEKEHYDRPDKYNSWTVEDFMKIARGYADDWGVPIENISFGFDTSHGYYDSIEEELWVIGFRLETDAEEYEREEAEKLKAYKAKVAAEEKARKETEAKEKRDIAEYQRLKAKFEKDKG